MTFDENTVAAARQILWRSGVLSWKLRSEQKHFKDEIENHNKQLIVGNISRRWGKSFTLVLFSTEQALRTKQKIRYAAAFKTDLEEFILPAFETILEDCPEDLRPKYIASKQEWRFKNGSVIKLVGLDKNPNGLRGNAINIIILDEAGYIANLKYQYTTVIIPATAKQKNIKIIVISTPPESPEHYFTELINKAALQDNGYYLELTIDDISDLDPAERKRLLDEVGGEDSPTAQREFFCKIRVDTTRAIAPSFSREHVKSFTPQHVNWQIFGDAGGVRDKTVFLQVGYDHESGLVVFLNELSFDPGTPTSKIVDAFTKKYSNNRALTLDAPGQLLIDYSSLGLPATLPPKDDFAAGLLLLNNAFHQCKAVINPECPLLIRTLEGGLLNKKRSDYERSEALGHCDAAAAAIYALRAVDKVTDLRPKPNKELRFLLPKTPPHEANLKGLTYG